MHSCSLNHHCHGGNSNYEIDTSQEKYDEGKPTGEVQVFMEQRRKCYHHRTTIYVPVPVQDKTGVLGKMNSPEPTPEAHTV